MITRTPTESLHYALILLEREEPGDVERAHAILRRVASQQFVGDVFFGGES